MPTSIPCSFSFSFLVIKLKRRRESLGSRLTKCCKYPTIDQHSIQGGGGGGGVAIHLSTMLQKLRLRYDQFCLFFYYLYHFFIQRLWDDQTERLHVLGHRNECRYHDPGVDKKPEERICLIHPCKGTLIIVLSNRDNEGEKKVIISGSG